MYLYKKNSKIKNVLFIVYVTPVPCYQYLFKNGLYIHIRCMYMQNSYFYIKCVKRVFFVHEKVFYAETKVEAV
jgi:hypothetical protein